MKPMKLPLTLGSCVERLARDVAADFLRRHVDQRRFRRDVDRLLDAADLER